MLAPAPGKQLGAWWLWRGGERVSELILWGLGSVSSAELLEKGWGGILKEPWGHNPRIEPTSVLALPHLHSQSCARTLCLGVCGEQNIGGPGTFSSRLVSPQSLGLSNSHDRALVKRKLKELAAAADKERKAQEKAARQREKVRRREREQEAKKS